MSLEAKRKDWKKRAAATYRTQEATGCRATYCIDDEVHLAHRVFRLDFRVVDEFVGAEIAQKCLVSA